MTAAVVAAIDQRVRAAGGAHFAEGDFDPVMAVIFPMNCQCTQKCTPIGFQRFSAVQLERLKYKKWLCCRAFYVVPVERISQLPTFGLQKRLVYRQCGIYPLTRPLQPAACLGRS